MKQFSLYNVLFILLLTTAISTMNAQIKTIPLWENAIPNSIENKDYVEKHESENGTLKSARLVSIPTLSIYIPKQEIANGTAVLIFPGGGYSHLAIDKEGFKVAEWLNTLGITAFVLKYRLPSNVIMTDKTVAPLQDAQEAMRYIRSKAIELHLNPEKIGIVGFSAGGHLAATLATHFADSVCHTTNKISARPDFSLLIYPVISMNKETTHLGCRVNLLGKSPSEEMVKKYSGELQVTKDTPPAFLVHATDDNAVPVENSINYYLALKKNNIPAEIHIYEKGGHGFGLGVQDTSKYWTQACEAWLKSNHFSK
ncbi:alpha/beta hydrolase [Flavobacterium sp. TMP13]|uniref:alpha/beta hydrolase n=1 Tax=Flavobacterium sp. TMP13 TaxID=3425950 RepID=UPI003D76E798